VRTADPEAAERLLGDAEECGVIVIDGHRVRFTHPLLAAGVYTAASPARRRGMHRRLAEIAADPEERARHIAQAAIRLDTETTAALDEGAARARSRGAPAAAAELLGLVIRLGADTAERRIALAQHHFDAGDPARARGLLEETVAELAPGRTRAEALALLAVVRLHDDSYQESAGYLEQALGEAGTDLRLRVLILNQLLFVLVNLGRIPDALRLTGRAVADAERLGQPGLLANTLASSVMIRFLSGQGLDEPTLERALDLENPDIPAPVMLRPTLISSLLLAWTGRLDEARERLLSIRQRCLERGEESDLMFTAFHTVIVECWRGNLADARLIAEDTLERALQLGTDIPLAIALATQANVAAYAGQADETRRAAHEALAIFARGSCLAGWTRRPRWWISWRATAGGWIARGRWHLARAAGASSWPPPVTWIRPPRRRSGPSASTGGCPCRSSGPEPSSSSVRSSAAAGRNEPPRPSCRKRPRSSMSSARRCGPAGPGPLWSGSTSVPGAAPG